MKGGPSGRQRREYAGDGQGSAGTPVLPAAHIRRDLTTGSIPKTLFHQAWPQAAEGVINVAYQITDLLWAGLLGGAQTLAGVGVAQNWIRLAITAQNGIVTGMRALIARALGQRDVPLANHIAGQAIFLGVAYALVMVIVGVALADVLMLVVGASAAVRAEAATYLRLQFVFLALIATRMQLGGALQTSGDPLSALKATLLARGLHMLLAPLFMFGWGGFPRLGLAGAAVANIIGQSIGLGLNWYALFWGNTQLRVTFRGFKLDFPLWRRLFSLSYPATITQMERSVAQLVLLRLVTPFGDVATAVFGIMGRMEVIGQFGANGVGQASGTLVGQNLGAGKPERARAAMRWGVTYVVITQGIILTIFFIWPAAVMRMFGSEPELLGLGSDWLRVQCFAFFFLGISQVFVQSYNIAGDVFAPMLVALAAVWFVEVPLAWLFSHVLGWGALGIAYAAVFGMGVRLFFFIPYYFTGRWMLKRVL